jgi:hypothetical protein
MLIVFDFHHTLSLRSGRINSMFFKFFEEQLENGMEIDIQIGINDLKSILKKYGEKSWYEAMKKSKLDAKIMMPTIDEVIAFIDFMKEKNSIFAVASMLEDEQFMFDLLKYCFEQRGKESPFTLKNVVSSPGLKETDVKSKSSHDKWPHIEVILKRNNYHFDKSEIVIIDDSIEIIKYMSSIGVCGIVVSDYFTINDWNQGCYIDF